MSTGGRRVDGQAARRGRLAHAGLAMLALAAAACGDSEGAPEQRCGGAICAAGKVCAAVEGTPMCLSVCGPDGDCAEGSVCQSTNSDTTLCVPPPGEGEGEGEGAGIRDGECPHFDLRLEASTTRGPIPLAVDFVATATGATPARYEWLFADGRPADENGLEFVDSFDAEVAAGQTHGIACASDDGELWLLRQPSERSDPVLSRLGPDGRVLETRTRIGTYAYRSLAFDGSHLYAGYIIGTRCPCGVHEMEIDGNVIRHFEDLRFDAAPPSLTWGDGMLWATAGDGRVAFLDPDGGHGGDAWTADDYHVTEIAWGGQHLWGVAQGPVVFRIDPRSGAMLKQYPLPSDLGGFDGMTFCGGALVLASGDRLHRLRLQPQGSEVSHTFVLTGAHEASVRVTSADGSTCSASLTVVATCEEGPRVCDGQDVIHCVDDVWEVLETCAEHCADGECLDCKTSCLCSCPCGWSTVSAREGCLDTCPAECAEACANMCAGE